jgi:Holliday junction resolvasome RuvABC endonuclease subunit
MRVLGVDPGMTRLGIGAIQVDGDSVSLITHGLIANPIDPTLKDQPRWFNTHLDRSIAQIATDFPRLLDIVQPDLIVAELVPVGKLGSNDALVIAASTTCKVIAFQFGVEWFSVGASTVKKGLTGNHRATKTQVRNAIFDMFPVVEQRHQLLKAEQKADGEKAEGLPFDVFDALAVAVVGVKEYAKQAVQAVPEE